MSVTLFEFKKFFLEQIKAHVKLFGLDFTKFMKPFLLGPSGIGKSEVVLSLKDDLQNFLQAEGYKEEVSVYYLPASDLEASISQVLYDTDEKRLKVIPLNLDPRKVTLLFIDEASNASPGFQGQLQSLLTSHQIGDYYFPKLIIVLAGNRVSDSILVNEFASTNVRRVCVFNIRFSPSDMVKHLSSKVYAIDSIPFKIKSTITSAIQYFAEVYAYKLETELNATSSLEEGQTFSPRQFEQYILAILRECVVSNVEEPTKLVELLNSELLQIVAEGLIGGVAAAHFTESVAGVLAENRTLEDFFGAGVDKLADEIISNPVIYNQIATRILHENFKEDLSNVAENADYVVSNIIKSNVDINRKVDIVGQIIHKLSIIVPDKNVVSPIIQNVHTKLSNIITSNYDKIDEAVLAIYMKTITEML